MATPRDRRRLAFQALFQLDARHGRDPQDVRASLDDFEEFSPEQRDEALSEALAAWAARDQADNTTRALAPNWPAHRQAAVDRAILRLAHYQMLLPAAECKKIINDFVEIAGEFSTDKSPGFINAILDKIHRTLTPPAPGPVDPPVSI